MRMQSPTKFNTTALGPTLAADDVAYFRAAATNSSRFGGVLSHIPGFPDSPIACILHSLTDIENPETWTAEVESGFSKLGACQVRFYVQQVNNNQREQLTKLGYKESTEIGLVRSLEGFAGRDLELLRCTTIEHWREYAHLSLVSGVGPEGHKIKSDSYARISRLKADAGYMIPYLARNDGQTVGFINLALSESLNGSFARGKNVLVHPDHRGQGVGSAMVASVMAEARRQGALYFGVYVIAGQPSIALYKGLGMVEVTQQTEWSKNL